MLEFQKDLDLFLFQAALGIQDPWFVSYRELTRNKV
jgi:hypothetical protein